MNRVGTFAVGIIAAALVLSLSGCDSKQAKVSEKKIELARDAADVLHKLNSWEDIAENRSTIEKAGARVRDQAITLSSLPQTNIDEDKKLSPEKDRVQGMLKDEMLRIEKHLGKDAADRVLNMLGWQSIDIPN